MHADFRLGRFGKWRFTTISIATENKKTNQKQITIREEAKTIL